MLLIEFSEKCLAEKEYVCQVIFEEFLGLPYHFSVVEISGIQITLRNGARLFLEDHFFVKCPVSFKPDSNLLPKQIDMVENVFIPDRPIPAVWGCNKLEVSNKKMVCGLDIFASVFFMLSRWEEIICEERDEHYRFPGKSSLAWKNGFLYRPVVDEMIEMLWNMLVSLDPNLSRKKTSGKIVPSCDVDFPFEEYVASPFSLFKACCKDILNERRIQSAYAKIAKFCRFRRADYSCDSNYTFEWYMDLLEEIGLKGVFFFLANNGETGDSFYNLCDEPIKKLLKQIYSRGHEIGIHSSYNSFQSPEKLLFEKKLMERTMEEFGIFQRIKGNRQHFLRWDASSTADFLENAGYEYDSTGGFADLPGFRFGTAKEFPMWSWKRRNKLKLKQKPLIVMDSTVLSPKYLGLCPDDARNLMDHLKQKCLYYKGNFVFLWHNSSLNCQSEKDLFCRALNKYI